MSLVRCDRESPSSNNGRLITNRFLGSVQEAASPSPSLPACLPAFPSSLASSPASSLGSSPASSLGSSPAPSLGSSPASSLPAAAPSLPAAAPSSGQWVGQRELEEAHPPPSWPPCSLSVLLIPCILLNRASTARCSRQIPRST